MKQTVTGKWMIRVGCMLPRFFSVGWIISVSNRDTRRIGCVTINSYRLYRTTDRTTNRNNVSSLPVFSFFLFFLFFFFFFSSPNVSSYAINHRPVFDTYDTLLPSLARGLTKLAAENILALRRNARWIFQFCRKFVKTRTKRNITQTKSYVKNIKASPEKIFCTG